jgi:hypothetical protein
MSKIIWLLCTRFRYCDLFASRSLFDSHFKLKVPKNRVRELLLEINRVVGPSKHGYYHALSIEEETIEHRQQLVPFLELLLSSSDFSVLYHDESQFRIYPSGPSEHIQPVTTPRMTDEEKRKQYDMENLKVGVGPGYSVCTLISATDCSVVRRTQRIGKIGPDNVFSPVDVAVGWIANSAKSEKDDHNSFLRSIEEGIMEHQKQHPNKIVVVIVDGAATHRTLRGEAPSGYVNKDELIRRLKHLGYDTEGLRQPQLMELWQTTDEYRSRWSEAEELAERMGAILLYLPNSHPYLNPIETLWRSAKSSYRQNGERSMQALHDEIQTYLGQIPDLKSKASHARWHFIAQETRRHLFHNPEAEHLTENQIKKKTYVNQVPVDTASVRRLLGLGKGKFKVDLPIFQRYAHYLNQARIYSRGKAAVLLSKLPPFRRDQIYVRRIVEDSDEEEQEQEQEEEEGRKKKKEEEGRKKKKEDKDDSKQKRGTQIEAFEISVVARQKKKKQKRSDVEDTGEEEPRGKKRGASDDYQELGNGILESRPPSQRVRREILIESSESSIPEATKVKVNNNNTQAVGHERAAKKSREEKKRKERSRTKAGMTKVQQHRSRATKADAPSKTGAPSKAPKADAPSKTDAPSKAPKADAPSKTSAPSKAPKADAPSKTDAPSKGNKVGAPSKTDAPSKAPKADAPSKTDAPSKAPKANAPSKTDAPSKGNKVGAPSKVVPKKKTGKAKRKSAPAVQTVSFVMDVIEANTDVGERVWRAANAVQSITQIKEQIDELQAWVGDEAINCIVSMLQTARSTVKGTHIYSTQEFRLMSHESRPIEEKARKYHLEENRYIFQTLDRLIFPNFINENHWVVIVVDKKVRQIQIYDSCNFKIDYLGRITLFLQTLWPEIKKWNLVRGLSSQQHGGNDCGIFSIANMIILAAGGTPHKQSVFDVTIDGDDGYEMQLAHWRYTIGQMLRQRTLDPQ